jgi:hypothetical protein
MESDLTDVRARESEMFNNRKLPENQRFLAGAVDRLSATSNDSIAV